MNSDELMSDPFGLQGGAAADLLYPPEAGASQAQQANAGNNNPAAWNTKKFKEEYDTMKGRLADQKFSSGRSHFFILFWDTWPPSNCPNIIPLVRVTQP